MDVIVQLESAECGLACLTTVTSHHGNMIGLLELRRRYALCLKGASLKRLISIAGDMGFVRRPLRLELEHLAQLPTLCILHWT